MNRQDILTALSDELGAIRRRFGVRELAVFGSVARDEARAGSDLDLLVTFDGKAAFDRYMDLKFFLEERFGIPVDLVTPASLRQEMRPQVERERSLSRRRESLIPAEESMNVARTLCCFALLALVSACSGCARDEEKELERHLKNLEEGTDRDRFDGSVRSLQFMGARAKPLVPRLEMLLSQRDPARRLKVGLLICILDGTNEKAVDVVAAELGR